MLNIYTDTKSERHLIFGLGLSGRWADKSVVIVRVHIEEDFR